MADKIHNDDLIAIEYYEHLKLIGVLITSLPKEHFEKIKIPKVLYHKEHFNVFETEYYNDFYNSMIKTIGELGHQHLAKDIRENHRPTPHPIFIKNVLVSDVKDLREKTGCGILQCKRALERFNGDFEFAKVFLKKASSAVHITNNRDRWNINQAILEIGRKPNIY